MLLALLLATAAPAPVDDAAYLSDCAGYATPLVCRCLADRLQGSNDGQLMLALTAAKAVASGLSDEQNAATVAAIRSRYGVANGEPIGPRLDTVMDSAAAACNAPSNP
jgi:hypothetical protein